MGSFSVSAATSNSSDNFESYIFQSSIQNIDYVKDRIILFIYAIVLIISIIQTFWKNQRIDRVLIWIHQAYANEKLESFQVYFHHQLMTCYRYEQRFSHIPTPRRIILLIIAIHIHILTLIVKKTLFIQRTESVSNCLIYRQPYQVLDCENNQDPCLMNKNTTNIPKCSYYYFEMTHVITMVTSVLTWHYAVRYFVIKIICFIRWLLFRDDERPRTLCCYFRGKQSILRCLIYVHYLILWMYLFCMVLIGLVWDLSISRLPVNLVGSVGVPIIITIDRLFSLILGIVPEMLQNWLDATNGGQILEDLKTKDLLLNSTDILVHVMSKKTKCATPVESHMMQSHSA